MQDADQFIQWKINLIHAISLPAVREEFAIPLKSASLWALRPAENQWKAEQYHRNDLYTARLICYRNDQGERRMVDAAKISIQMGGVSLSAEGSEDFVREAIAVWDRLTSTAAAAEAIAGHHTSVPPPKEGGLSKAASEGITEYENVFDEVDNRLKLIAHVPGTSKADRTRNVALAVLYGHYLRGEEQVPSEVIRDACADQGCFDQANFAQSLRGLKEKLAMNTKPGGGYDVKLTSPGRRAARELIDGLNREG